jgi:hypothetical protein
MCRIKRQDKTGEERAPIGRFDGSQIKTFFENLMAPDER